MLISGIYASLENKQHVQAGDHYGFGFLAAVSTLFTCDQLWHLNALVLADRVCSKLSKRHSWSLVPAL